jgi:hypothetical protein
MNTRTDNTAEVGLHIFERAGLGKAPFRCVGFEQKHYEPAPGVRMVGGSCDYCGTGIVQMFYIQGADGRKFKVGCDCVEKTGDAGLIKAYKNNPKYRKMLRDARQARDTAKIEKLQAQFEAGKEVLRALPSPNQYSPNLLEYFTYVLSRCGTAGKKKWLASAIKIINEKAA